MSFRLVSKSVTLNDPERRNGPYFAPLYPPAPLTIQDFNKALYKQVLTILILLLLLLLLLLFHRIRWLPGALWLKTSS